jgi:hypothetical protein
MLGYTQFLVAAVHLCGPDEPAQLVHGSPGRRCTYAARNPETQKRPSVRQTTKVVARVYPRAASALACARRTFLPLGSVPTGCLANRPEAPEHTAHRTSHTAWLSVCRRSRGVHRRTHPAHLLFGVDRLSQVVHLLLDQQLHTIAGLLHALRADAQLLLVGLRGQRVSTALGPGRLAQDGEQATCTAPVAPAWPRDAQPAAATCRTAARATAACAGTNGGSRPRSPGTSPPAAGRSRTAP